MKHESGREEMEPRNRVLNASPSAFERRPCPVCGHMLSVLKLELRLQPHTCPYCASELLLPNNIYQRER